ncbi:MULTISPECIES: Hpt domain-containing protein [Ramlibacter]|uniref:Chemotaxis protein CheA n=1 Tax=Ramlibacter pinisoli TaxID=2682844 RepID=A0A6N8IW65_9BURK|nr:MULTISPECIES: Hpt domain-containing protein [Ramlibacter]MBA2965248.1 Hpt domain-containing protein [Ramlibacter sp. CGMCC 1.13660]MVQ30213.1 response regulator [Ramlibacter pinisoli]
MQANDTDLDLATNDLGPLAWVLDELRKSLDSATAALRRFVRDAGLARGSDMASVDAGQLRIARQQLHQAVGALEMVGLAAPAHVLRSMEAAAQKFVERPELCSEAAAAKVEKAGFALTEYLEGLLLGKPTSSVALFPQYRDVQELAGSDRIHPADLWPYDWRWVEPETPAVPQTLIYDPAVRSRMDQAVLRIVKSADAAAARDVVDCSLGLAAGQAARQPRIFWKLCAGYFEAVAGNLLPVDVYVKRAASRVLLQYATLAKGEQGVSDRLAQDLLFFCSQAVPAKPVDAPSLASVRAAYGLGRYKPVDYQTPQFGRFDPVLLTQARKRIAAAKDTWSALSGGDGTKLRPVAEQFHLISESLTKLHPASAPLAQALSATVDGVVRAGQPPRTEVAMEVATAVLYLEAAFQDLDPSDSQLAVRTARLAERLDQVRHGGQAQALESWMEELYRRVSDRQTMGSVVSELRGTLGELEKVLDAFFRNPSEKAPLQNAPTHLLQMRGVLSVLGLDQAAQAVVRMRETVEAILLAEPQDGQAGTAASSEKLGNNLGALGFLIDMLNYQPTLAKKLFVYDDARGELRPLMGRMTPVASAADAAGALGEARGSDAGAPAATHAIPAVAPAPAPGVMAAAQPAAPVQVAPSAVVPPSQPAAALPVSAPVVIEEPPDAELLEIFLEEAREVVGNGLAALETLASNPADVAELTTLRRAFHTLKGSSRMVGLNEFGEAGWSMEQVLNTWLADQRPASDKLCTLATEALRAFGRWVDDIAARNNAAWKAGMFRVAADALRNDDRLLPIGLPDAAAAPQPELPSAAAGAPEVAPVPALSLPDFAADIPAFAAAPVAPALPSEPPALSQAEPAAELPAFSLDLPEVTVPAIDSAVAPLDAPATQLDFMPIDEVIEAPEVSEVPLEDFDLSLFTSPAPAASPTVSALAVPDVPAVPDASADAAADEGLDFHATHVIRGEPVVPVEMPVAELPAAQDFVVDLDFVAEPPVVADLAAAPPVISGIDFDSLDAIAQPAQPQPATPADVTIEAPAAIQLPAAIESIPAIEEHAAAAPPVDDQTKVIGGLRIGIPLYNVYLNEADEWSRRLATEIGEWAMELGRPVPDSVVGLAHALAGSSATVGFQALSEVARTLESSLQHAQTLAYGTPQHGQAFVNAAEEIRRLLHQFAAGFLKDADQAVVRALHAADQLVLPKRPELRDSGPGDLAATELAAPVRGAAATQFVAFDSLPVPSAAQAVTAAGEVAEGEEDIDAVDALDPDLFSIFEEEAAELMPLLGGALRLWASKGDAQARDGVLRALHTLKGSARLAGALRMGELAHRMESAVEGLPPESHGAALDPLLQRFDTLQANFDRLRAGTEAAGANPTLAAPLEAAPTSAAPLAGPAPEPSTPAPAVPRSALPVPVASQLVVPRAASNQAVRVRSQLLDRLMNQAGEVMITRSRLENELRNLRGSLNDLTGNLDRLRSQLRDIELQAESQMQSRLAQAKEAAAGFDPLEFDRFTRVQELTRMMAESVNDVATVQRNLQRTVEATEDDLIAQARQTRELQRDLLRTRMVEFESISDRLYRVVRLASKESARQVKLDITGGSIEMDRGVLDRMTGAFEHLLRNCVAHGIEEPAVRAAAGKDPTGTILIHVQQEGNDVAVEFRDDGAGLNLARIRDKALQQGLITADQPLTDADAANLIFMPGFSTAAQVTELAGRGIGMDVVRSEINALGGRIETSTQAGRGTSFKLVLPLTTAVTQVVMIRSGTLALGVPANLVETVRRAPAREVEIAYNSGSYGFDGEQLPFFWSGALLQSSPRSTEPQGKTLPVIVFRSAAQRVALHVDEVLGNQEVVVKNLGPQLARLPGLAGMTVLASGAVVLIYNPVALAAVYGEQARLLSADRAQPEQLASSAGVPAAEAPAVAPQIPLVLVVDDSITVRRVTQRLLQREGYRVALAADGLQALERLAEERPAVVLSDIEMPRMDGFDLARNIRADARWAALPIVMITSRIAEKHREHARELGVNHYLGKPYAEEELLSLVRHYSVPAKAPA